jgi:hypothetical protein
VSTRPSHIDVAPRARVGAPLVALLLGILSLPGSWFTWDWFAGGGFVIGLPLAIAAIAVGLHARARTSGRERAIATAGVALGACAVLIPVVWMIADALG